MNIYNLDPNCEPIEEFDERYELNRDTDEYDSVCDDFNDCDDVDDGVD